MNLALLLLLATALTPAALAGPGGRRRRRSVLRVVTDPRPPAAPAAAPQEAVGAAAGKICTTGCSQKITVVDSNRVPESAGITVTAEEFTALRIEYIKNQILKKLKLEKKPKISLEHLPEDQSILPKPYEDYVEARYFDDYYSKTAQSIVFPSEDGARCDRSKRYPSACLPFQLPLDIQAADISTAELLYYKLPDPLDDHNQTFVISEVDHWDYSKNFKKIKPIAIQETDVSEGWLRTDVAYVIRNWLEYRNESQPNPIHAINVACKTCGMSSHKSPISFKNSLKPFLVIYTHPQRRTPINRQRQKRAIDCGSGVHDCCRESLYVSFAEIGWDDWILEPKGYNAYFCKGSCMAAASLTLSGSQHNNILQKVMYRSPNKGLPARLELTPCCAATRYYPLQLLLAENNKTVSTKILPNMIVGSCGCM